MILKDSWQRIKLWGRDAQVHWWEHFRQDSIGPAVSLDLIM